ncbi:MAG: hypothetical protein KKA73_02805 [Chloroflexi bacterium]|nr:hypothetical protein [Chloroflexota bacterium]MBU1746594.1 hypothetical protein [Chloroflexota bacterium]MBU1877681.1 hypothetical protein [Chloroflexota bacterium]
MIPTNWPRWMLIVIGLSLVVATILVALVLEPVAQAMAPQIEPTPTMVQLAYAGPLSENCETCHFDQVALTQAGANAENLDLMTIEPESLQTIHGRLGCVTCHRGTGGTDDAQAAHEGLVLDPSLHFAEECLLCHRDMPEVFPQDRLRTPHDAVTHGTAVNVSCSDCHGGVGHGFDPVTGNVVCSMEVCLDCHEERQLDSKLSDCSSCHIGAHDVAAALECSVCHQTTTTWQQVSLAIHPMPLVGKHATLQCFDCHKVPNFKGLQLDCLECHARAETEQFHATKNIEGIAGQCNLCHEEGKTN